MSACMRVAVFVNIGFTLPNFSPTLKTNIVVDKKQTDIENFKVRIGCAVEKKYFKQPNILRLFNASGKTISHYIGET